MTVDSNEDGVTDDSCIVEKGADDLLFIFTPSASMDSESSSGLVS